MKTPALRPGRFIAAFLAFVSLAFAVETKSAVMPSKTTITSETLEMVSGQSENTFYFSKKVRVVGTNLRLNADKLVVTAQRAADAPAVPNAMPTMGTIHKIIAEGNVRIFQEGREATSGHAEFFPKEGKVVLTENPRVIDAKAIVSGWRITMFHGERKVTVEQDPSETIGRPTVNLESLPDLGFDPAKQPPAEKPALPVVKAVTLSSPTVVPASEPAPASAAPKPAEPKPTEPKP